MAKTRSEYLKIMYGEQAKNINSLGYEIGDTTSAPLEVKTSDKSDRNRWQRTMDTLSDGYNELIKGTFNFIDDVFDFGVNTVASMGLIDEQSRKNVVGYDWQNPTTEVLSRINNFGLDIATGDMFTEDYWKFYDDPYKNALKSQSIKDKNSWANENQDVKNFVDNVIGGVGYMLPSLLTGNATASIALMSTGAGAGAFNEAFEETQDYGKSLAYGVASGGVEAISELALGKVFKALGIGTGKIMGTFGGEVSESFVKDVFKTAIEEGLEESATALVEPILQTIYKDQNLSEIYLDKDFWKGVGNEALVGATIGGVLGSVSLKTELNALGKDGVAISNALETAFKEESRLRHLEKGTESYNKVSERLAKALTDISTRLKNGNFTEEQRANLDLLFSNPNALATKLELEDFNDVERFKTKSLFYDLEKRNNTNVKLVIDDTIEHNGNYNPKTNTITLKSGSVPTLVHEYVGHVLGNSLSSTQRTKIYNKVSETKWYKDNYANLKKAYAKVGSSVWQNETIAKYIEDVVRNAKTSEISVRKTLLDNLKGKVNKRFKNLLENDLIAKEFIKDIKHLSKGVNDFDFEMFSKDISELSAVEVRKISEDRIGTRINLSDLKKALNEANFKLKGKDIRKLFLEYNLLGDSHTDYKYFVNQLLTSKNANGLSYEEYIKDKGINVEEFVDAMAQNLKGEIDSKSTLTKQTLFLNSVIKDFEDFKVYHKANNLLTAHLISFSKELDASLKSKVGSTGNANFEDESRAKLFKKLLSKIRYKRKNGDLSASNLKNFSEYYKDGSFDKLLANINKDFAIDTSLLELVGKNLAETYDPRARTLTTEQLEMFDNIVQGLRKIYKDISGTELERDRQVASQYLSLAKETADRHKKPYTKMALDNMGSKGILSTMFSGDTSLYEDYILKPYDKQVGKEVEFLKKRDSFMKVTEKKRYNKVRIGSLKVNRYVLYQFYLNTLSDANVVRMLNGGINYKTKQGTNKEISFEQLEQVTKETLTQEEIKELNELFKFYNTDLKAYVEEVSKKNFGFSVSVDNYYPIKVSDTNQIQDFTQTQKNTFNLNAMTNSNLKSRSNEKSKIEINLDPFNVFNKYVKTMTITGEIGQASKKLNRIFNLKVNNKNVIQVLGKFIPNINEYISSVMNKLIANTNTIERSGFIDRIVGNTSRALLGLNVPSTLKQIASLFTPISRVGFNTWLKGIKHLGLIENHKYLKEHSGIYSLRVYEKGFTLSETLTPEFSQRILRKISNATLYAMEMTDRMVTCATFNMAKEYASKLYGLEYGSKENLVKATELFNDLLLSTQSNSDRIAMSRVRSGEKGVVVKNLFGLFHSDAQNKFELLHTAVDKVYNENTRSQALKEIGLWSSGIVASSVVVMLADMIANYIYDKEEEPSEIYIELALNTFVSWIPYVDTLVNSLRFGETNFLPTQALNDLIATAKSLIDGNVTKKDLVKFITQVAQFYGLPANNLLKLVNGVIAKFDPKVALETKTLLYGASATYLNNETNKLIEKGNIKKATSTLEYNYDLHKCNISESVALEIVKLKSQGIKVSFRNKPEKQAQQVNYDKLGDILNEFIQSYEYKNLTNENKAKAIAKLSNIYYDYSVDNETKFNALINKDINVSKYLRFGFTDTLDLLDNLNSSSMSYDEKLLALHLSGVKLNKEKMTIIEKKYY